MLSNKNIGKNLWDQMNFLPGLFWDILYQVMMLTLETSWNWLVLMSLYLVLGC